MTHTTLQSSTTPLVQESMTPIADTAVTTSSHLPYLRPISESEFKLAPLRVRLIVSHEQVVSAVDALNHAIRQALETASVSALSPPLQRVHVAEAEVHRIWQSLAEWTMQQRQRLLAVLCHFGRLQLRNVAAPENGDNDDEREAVYDVVG